MNINRALKVTHDTCKAVGWNMRRLPPALSVVHLIERLDFEVNRGGVRGWLINTSGAYGSETAQALEIVGADRAAAILREVLAFFPGGAPALDEQSRIQQVAKASRVDLDRWRELGSRLVEWPENIYALLQQFVTAHEAEFATCAGEEQVP